MFPVFPRSDPIRWQERRKRTGSTRNESVIRWRGRGRRGGGTPGDLLAGVDNLLPTTVFSQSWWFTERDVHIYLYGIFMSYWYLSVMCISAMACRFNPIPSCTKTRSGTLQESFLDEFLVREDRVGSIAWEEGKRGRERERDGKRIIWFFMSEVRKSIKREFARFWRLKLQK